MKVLIVHNSYQQPGGEDVVFEQERRLLERGGHTVITYRRTNHEMEGLSSVRRLTLIKTVVWASDARRDLENLIRKERPQIVHVHNTFMMVSPSIYSACAEQGVPVVQTLHNYRLLCSAATLFRDGKICEECIEHSLWRGVRYGCYRGSRSATAGVALMLAVHRAIGTWGRDVACYIALTDFARQKFVAAGLPREKILVKPNFVENDPGVNAGPRSFALYVGRLSVEKGVSTLLAAWARLQQPIPLVIVGDGPLRGELEAQVASRNLRAVQFRGHLPREQTFALISQARFLVFPSEWYEPFGLCIVEGFACGTPVICSRLGSLPGIVEDGLTGLHFNPGDPENLAQKVAWAWDHIHQMAEMGKKARREYETKYTAEKNYARLMEIYDRAISGYKRAAA
jgi:glycosyltransferase involved in cell wall biosynthesis